MRAVRAARNVPWVVVGPTDSVANVSDRITPADVAKVATLARLTLTDDELATATTELGAMLDYFAEIDALDLDGVEPMNNPTHLVNVMRDDVVGETLDRDEVLAAAPVTEDHRFRVPPILGLDD
jgi:aspartyl-tRNA(Asn)/glutamyl-tRNA(Gln) amidotransferase subunit C